MKYIETPENLQYIGQSDVEIGKAASSILNLKLLKFHNNPSILEKWKEVIRIFVVGRPESHIAKYISNLEQPEKNEVYYTLEDRGNGLAEIRFFMD